MQKQKWKDIKGYEGHYQVSTNGLVRSVKRTITGRDGRLIRLKGGILKESKARMYDQVNLSKNKTVKTFMVHRLVALTFIKTEKGKIYVNHKNGNKKDNRLQNLELVTARENVQHAIKSGLRLRCPASPHNAVFTSRDVLKIRSEYTGKWGQQTSMAKKYGVEKKTIWNILNHKTWKGV